MTRKHNGKNMIDEDLIEFKCGRCNGPLSMIPFDITMGYTCSECKKVFCIKHIKIIKSIKICIDCWNNRNRKR